MLMLVASALVHLGFLALFLLEWRDTPPQGSSPPSIDIMVDPQPAADVAAERPPDPPSDRQGEPTAPEVPTPPAPPEPQVPQPPPEPAPAEPAPAEPAPAPPVQVETAPPPPAAPEAPPEPPTPEPPAPAQIVPEPVAPEAILPPPREAPPTPAPRPSPPAVNLDLAPPVPIPAPVLTPPPAPPAPPVRRLPAFPAPIVSSWNANPFAPQPQRQPRGNNGIDLSLGPVARESREARGAPPRGSQDTDAGIRVVGAQVGSDWIRLMQEWWVRHRYYPTQAAANNESGTVQVHLNMDRFGRVRSVRIEGTSGSQWLDAGSLSIFRNAQLPPFPSGTLEPNAELHLTLSFYLVRR